ncbi:MULTISPECIES: cysteine peptidase family C39 domain-containing protein [unclassified Nostoc]|uniref:cysteine peptidase family C39 domain-containing protein n=1 Tax=Nostoc sp. S13 TaxID=3019266 RepID=UPI002639D71F|nr:cysteine peptidase family C39 domain-containing protein [Nostoc sp. S13]MDF5734554.1 cysteine peptidase family C39 domain-containing protein [Nostoc sp. S13]
MKYQIVLQHSKEDCDAAFLATIAKHHGRTFTLKLYKGRKDFNNALSGLDRIFAVPCWD